MKRFAILALAAMIALPASAAGVTISGYLDIGYIAAEGGSSIGGANYRGPAVGSTNGNWDADDGFALNELNLDIASQLTNDISMFASVDALFNNTALRVDYAYVDFANPGPFDLNVRAGRIPSVVGIEQRVSESNQNKFISLSLLSPFTVGAMDGVAVYGSFSPVNYALALSNGDIIGNTTGATMGVAPYVPGNNNGVALLATNDNNNNFAVSGRIGVVPIEGLEVGVSGSYDKWRNGGLAGGVNNNTRDLMGVDASYVWGALTLKGEYVTVQEEQQSGVADIRASGFYVEGLYDLNAKITLGARYAAMESEQAATGQNAKLSEYTTATFLGTYRLADNVVLKAEYALNQEKMLNRIVIPSQTVEKAPNNVFALSLVGSF